MDDQISGVLNNYKWYTVHVLSMHATAFETGQELKTEE